MTTSSPLSYSVLDLAPIFVGGEAGESFRNTLDLAQHAERWGFHRFWLAEHHNIPAVASAATSVLIAYVAANTETIRVGSGGIMLPNHAPLVIAEQFGTLESLFPGRIDLGIGRAPGGDARTARALRRFAGPSADTFPEDLHELMEYFQPATPEKSPIAIPGAGLKVPIFLLGSSDFSARLAARLGLPFAFASHFAPGYLHFALDLYRSNFQPSEQLKKPYVMIAVNAFAADDEDEAWYHFTSLEQQFLNLIRNVHTEVPPPVESMDGLWSPMEREKVESMIRFSVVGNRAQIKEGLESIIELTGASEIIVTASIYDHAARLRSFEIVSEAFQELTEKKTVVA